MTLAAFPQPTPFLSLVASLSVEGDTTVVALCGEADVGTLPVVADVLAHVIHDRTGPVVVDLAQTTFMDTATVRALVRARLVLLDRGRQLAFRAPSRLAARVLTLFGLLDLVEATEAVAS